MRFLPRLYAVLGVLLIVGARPASAQGAQSRLWDASIGGDTVGIRQAIADGAQIDSLDTRRNLNGRRALNWAAWNNQVSAVKLLLALGAQLEAENRTGFSALHHAAEAGSMEAVRALLAAGANPGHANGDGRLPAETARDRGYEAVASILEAAKRPPPRR
jgi:ankyrin repeat protein